VRQTIDHTEDESSCAMWAQSASLPERIDHENESKLDLASVLNKRIQLAFRRIGITGVGWHTFRHSVGTMLAEMGEHQLTIRDYLRHSNLHVTNKHLNRRNCLKEPPQSRASR
jgi:integrase